MQGWVEDFIKCKISPMEFLKVIEGEFDGLELIYVDKEYITGLCHGRNFRVNQCSFDIGDLDFDRFANSTEFELDMYLKKPRKAVTKWLLTGELPESYRLDRTYQII